MPLSKRVHEAKPVWLVAPASGEPVPDVDISANTTPRVGNAPASPGQALLIEDSLSHEITQANLVLGAVYELILIPATPTDFIRGVYKCAAAGGSISSQTDGWPVFSNSPERICLPTGSTKLRVYIRLDTATPGNATAYLSRVDA